MAGKTILVVEPDLDASSRLEKFLEGAGYYVVTMPDVESALLVFEYVEPDLVLVAYPTGNRATDNIAAMIRSSGRPRVPTIAMFPFPHRSLALQALSDGCIDVIPKPVDRLLVEDLVRNVLRAGPDSSGPLSGIQLVS